MSEEWRVKTPLSSTKKNFFTTYILNIITFTVKLMTPRYQQSVWLSYF